MYLAIVIDSSKEFQLNWLIKLRCCVVVGVVVGGNVVSWRVWWCGHGGGVAMVG